MFSVSCEKNDLPVVKTLSFKILNLDTVILTGEVVNTTDVLVTKRGFYWGITANPGINDYLSENQSGPGIFTENVTNLSLGLKYYFRSYAVTSDGTQLGEVQTFKIELNPTFGKMIDPRDGRTYSTVTIQNQTWMAENLDYLPAVSPSWSGSEMLPHYYVYDYEGTEPFVANNTESYETYGVLYNWTAAIAACPPNWHLPSDEEWIILTNYLGKSAGGILKETGTNHWSDPNIGASNLIGFTALAAGCRRYDAGFYYRGNDAYFWSSTENNQYYSINRYIYNSGPGIFRLDAEKTSGFSVRCLLNVPLPASTWSGNSNLLNE